MRSLQEANASTENDNTTALTPFRKTFWWIVIGLVGLAFLIAMLQYGRQYKQSRARESTEAAATSQGASIPLQLSGTLVIPPHKSKALAPIAGYHPELTSYGKFEGYAERLDGSTCVSGAPDCVTGPLLKSYLVTNESDETITVTFEFKRD